MNRIIDWVLIRRRAVILILGFLMIAGISAFQSIPKEAEPDIAIPMIYVSMRLEGVSPEDGERLLVRPMEKELKSIEGIKEMRAQATEGHASVTLEFDAGFDSEKALSDVREKVDIAKVKLPGEADEPEVHEVNVALFPVLTITLSGPISERQLIMIARNLKDDVEALEGVLEVDIGGDREEVLEVTVDPLVLDTYDINFEQVLNTVQRNNQLVAAGAIDNGHGRMVVKVPGVIETLDDIESLPIKTVNGKVVTFKDVASIRSTFKDPSGFARVNGDPAVSLEVKKRVGANIIQTIEEIKQVVNDKKAYWPEPLKFTYITDKSNQIRDMLGDLQDNVTSAIIMVMIVIVAALGLRSSVLVGLAIPASFLSGIFIINQLGLTLNIVVLFSLILVVGMLVDGAIVVTELATRHMDDGDTPKEAFGFASKRMAWPIIASTITTLTVFLPLIAWPGVVGEFMKFLPITVIICLTASLFVALLFLPVLGSLIGKANPEHQANKPNRFTRAYVGLLVRAVKFPATTTALTFTVMALTVWLYAANNRGIEFFPEVEPNTMQVLVHARGDLSIYEKDALLRQVEKRLRGMNDMESLYARSFNQSRNGMSADVVGTILFQLKDWQLRRKADDILVDLKQRTQDIPGIQLEFRKEESGPGGGKPIKLQVSAIYLDSIEKAVNQIRGVLDQTPGFKDVEDDRSLPGIEWRIAVDRIESARYGADVATVGGAIQMVTKGLKVSEFRPDHTDEEVDIIIRFPKEERGMAAFDHFNINTISGMTPLTNFINITPAPKTGSVHRVDSKRAVTIQADVETGINVAAQLQKLQASLKKLHFADDVRINFKGEDADQKETSEFLGNAFSVALFLMFLILVIQFNSFYQSALILSAIVFSTAGVLIGLLVTAQPFGIVMVGLGIIALAGIVVNNNIVLIDTYNGFRKEGRNAIDAAIETGSLRMRPVLLTAGTTVLGLIPMVLAMNIDFINREISFGAPSTQWWTQLASAIAGGLSFATVLTLLLTPALLVLGENVSAYFRKHKARWRQRGVAKTETTPITKQQTY